MEKEIIAMDMDTRFGEVATRAYFIWEQEGRPYGKDLDHWFQAEAEIGSEGGKKPRKKATKPTAKRRSGAKKQA